MTVSPPAAALRGGPADLVAVLVLIEVAAGLLAAVGLAIFMANPLYVLVPVAKAVLLLVLAARLARGRRRATVAMLVVQGVSIVGFWFGLILGATPWLAASVTLTGLLTGVAVPLLVIWCCVALLRAPRCAEARA